MLLFVVSLPAVTARLYSSDEVEYFSYLRSIYFDRDVSFENEYQHFYDRNVARSEGFHETFLERATALGRRVNYATIGPAILWLPFYAVADVFTRATGMAEANGFTKPYIAAVAYGSACYAFLAVLLSIRAARVLGRQPDANGEPGPDTDATRAHLPSLIAGLAVWFGTPLLFYMYVAPPFSHACSAFTVALFLSVWLHVRREWRPRGALALGLCVALMTMVREQDAFLALGPALDFVLFTARGAVPQRALARGHRSDAAPSGRSPGRQTLPLYSALAGVSGALLGYVPQLLAYTSLNGYPGPAEHVSRKMSWYAPHALEVLASAQHGFFFWTPLAMLAIGGLLALSDRRMSLYLLIMVASQVYVAGSVESWTVAGAFGQRRFVCLTAILVIGLTALLNTAAGLRRTQQRGFRIRHALTVVLFLCVWWNLALMAQFATRLMDRQRLEPSRNAYHAFVTLPLHAPSLAYRYLTDRESFYEARPGGPSR